MWTLSKALSYSRRPMALAWAASLRTPVLFPFLISPRIEFSWRIIMGLGTSNNARVATSIALENSGSILGTVLVVSRMLVETQLRQNTLSSGVSGMEEGFRTANTYFP